MIERSLLKPFTRHQAKYITQACSLVSGGCLSQYARGCFSMNGACNVQIAKNIVESIVLFVNEKCIMTGLHSVVRLDPLVSFEALLHPSNLLKDSFRYASRINEAHFFVESVSCVVSDYGKLCHILGSSVCLSLIDIKDMCLSEGISDDDCNAMVSLMQDWLFGVLQRSQPYIQHKPIDVINVEIDLEVVLAFFFGLRSSYSIYNDGTFDTGTVKKIDNIVNKLWELLFSRSTEYGGPVFCLFKLASAMSTIKSALILSSAIDWEPGSNYREVVLENIFMCFKFTCNECSNGPNAWACGKQIIVGSSSNDAICDAIKSVVTVASSPMKVLSSLLLCVRSTEWLDKFTWFESSTVNIAERLKRDLMLPYEMIEGRCASRLTSLAIKSIPHISSNDLPSLMAIMDNGFGACCAQRDESMDDSKICLKDSFMTAMKCYELFFEAQVKSTKRTKWNKWLECVVLAFPNRSLRKHDLCSFVVFVSGLCIFPRHMECIMEIACKVRSSVNKLWCSGMSSARACCIADVLVTLCKGALFLDDAESKPLRSWLEDNIYIGSNIMEVNLCNRMDGFDDCYRRGRFLLPYEM